MKMAESNERYRRFSNDLSTVTIPPAAKTTSERQPREKYQHHLYIFGVVENSLGSLILCACIASLIAQSISGIGGYTYISPGLWCGIFLFGSGILGIMARNNSSVRIYAANMVASIFAAAMMVVLVTLSVICSLSISVYDTAAYIIEVMHGANALMGFAALLVCIIHSAYCCGGLCCSASTSHTVVYNTQQFVQMANGEYMLAPAETAHS